MKKEILIKQLIAQDARKLSSTEMCVKPLDNITLRDGDVFTFPRNWRDYIFAQPCRGIANCNELFIIVETFAHRHPVKFYPSTLFKRVKVSDGWETSTGSFVDFCQMFALVDEAIDSAVDRMIRVRIKKIMRTIKGVSFQTNMYTYDFVDL